MSGNVGIATQTDQVDMATPVILTHKEELQRVYRKIGFRIVPLVFLGYIVAFLDRINIGYAQLQFVQDLKFSEAIYGFGAGLFFFGYFLFEVPSNILLEKIGARLTLLRIMVLWG